MTNAEGSRIVLGEINTDLEVVGPPERAWQRRREVVRLARDRLPRRLAQKLDPILAGRDGVIRIRRLELDVGTADGAVGSGLLEAWSRQLALALEEAITRGSGADVAIFANHSEYLAAYVVSLVSGDSSTSWAYEDFAPLRHLAPAEAALEVLTSRPGCLPDLALRLTREHRLVRFVEMVGEKGARRLLDAAAASTGAAPEPTVLAGLVEAARGEESDLPGAHAPALAILLQALTAAELPLAPAAAAALTLARCREEAAKLGANERSALRRSLEAAGEERLLPRVGEQGPFAVLERLPSSPGLARAVLGQAGGRDSAPVLPEPPAREFEPVLPESAASPVQPVEVSRRPVVERTFPTSFAGLALVLPVFRALDLVDHLGHADARLVLSALVDEESRRLLSVEPLVDVLLPPDPAAPPATRPDGDAWPPPGAARLIGLAPDRKVELESAGDARGYADLVTAHLAARLYGLSRSTLPYLRAQFLHRAGSVLIDDDMIHVRIDPMPLGVVLRLSGMIGDRGRLPWADDRRLLLSLLER